MSESTPKFHDIKQIPDFAPWPWEYILPLLLLLFLIVLAWFLKRRRNGKVKPQFSPTIAPPLEELLESLRHLEDKRGNKLIALREYSSQASLAFRHFLERTLNFPAKDQTATEVSNTLPLKLTEILPTVSKEFIRQQSLTARETLRLAESLAFSDTSTSKYHLESQEVLSLGSQIQQIAKSISAQLSREQERTRSVMETRD